MKMAAAVSGALNTHWRTLLGLALLSVSQCIFAQAVSALGRLEPEDGVLAVSVASTPMAVSGSVIRSLLVEEGDWVEAGQLLAETDSTALFRAMETRSKAELELAIQSAEAAESQAEEACTLAEVAASEAARRSDLLAKSLASTEETEQAQGEARSKAASCKAAQANARVAQSAIKVAESRIIIASHEVERSLVRAPVDGRVLEVHTRAGEMAGQQPLLDLGRTDRMFAIAEVYETDIGRVRVGQKAKIRSRALAQTVTGTVEHIRGEVQKKDVIGTDPAAHKDARIIEVEIRLDDSDTVAALTYLQVEVIIGD